MQTDFNPFSYVFLSFCIFDYLGFFWFIYRFLSQHPNISDDLPNHIISGRVQVKPNVNEYTETDAIFDDGSREETIDVVIFATGYSFSFPFLNNLINVTNNKVSLYKFMFPHDLEQRRQWHPTLVLLPGKSHGCRSLEGCSPWGR